MNNLNSIILEGTIITNPVKCNIPDESDFYIFTVSSQSLKDKEKSYFEISANTQLTENYLSHLKIDRVVRVVGRLKQITSSSTDKNNISTVVIIAEHMEVEPLSTIIK